MSGFDCAPLSAEELKTYSWIPCYFDCGRDCFLLPTRLKAYCGVCQEPKAPPTSREIWDKIKKKVAPKIYERDGTLCNNCGTEQSLIIDHIIPLAKGGTNDPDNLQVLCINCNRSKGAKLDWDGVILNAEKL